MAFDVCSEVSSLVVSPRISFSHDLKESDRMILTPVRESHPLISTIDFDFCITTDQIFSSADELFANGKILPVDLKKPSPPKPTFHHSSSTNKPTPLSSLRHTKRQMLKELLSQSANSEEAKPPPPAKPPFWQFKRSFSLNCENGRSNSLIRSLQFLSRSNSTGSAQNQRRNSKKEPPPAVVAMRAASSCGGDIHSHPLRSSSKKSSSSSPLKKSRSGRAYGSLKISPVLNIPPAYISKATLFGLSSLFCNAKAKKKRK